MKGSGVFIEPEGSLKNAIIERKQWLEKTMPQQPFCSHPPHSTLLFGDYGFPEIWVQQLADIVAQFSEFSLETEGFQEFPNDPGARGGYTIAFRIRRTPAIMALQHLVAECLAPYRRIVGATHSFAAKEPFASSLKHYGSPFVGSHWIPHFTIGSPLVTAGDPLIKRLCSGPGEHIFSVRMISVWRVEDDTHERLEQLALKPATDHS